MPRSRKRSVPDVSPEEGFAWLARQERRASTKAANHAATGYVHPAQRRLDELAIAAEAELITRLAVLPPAIERAREYVMCWDEDGQYVGLRPAGTPLV